MAITKEQKEYFKLLAQTTAQETVDKCISKLPCKSHIEKIDDHDRLLHNGLKQSVERLETEIKKMNGREEQKVTEQRTGRRAFWRAFSIGIGVTAIGAIIGYLIKLL